MPRGKRDTIQNTTTPANAAPNSIWAMMTGADPERLAEWDYNTGALAVLVGETLQTGAAITFGAKRDLSGMSVRVFADGAVVLQQYFDNCFELNEWIEQTGTKLREMRLRSEQKTGQP